jgi:hypothetical protein
MMRGQLTAAAAAAGIEVRSPTPTQVAAVRSVMQLFVEDDLARGVTRHSRLWCVACASQQQAPGFVRYDGYWFCNPCATSYELARLSGTARVVADVLGPVAVDSESPSHRHSVRPPCS